ncbi:N-acetylglutaminylglutamine amidotransferase, partial [Hydrogenophilus islandicus]
KGVRKIPPATVVTIEPDGRETRRTFWQLDFTRSREEEERPLGEWAERVLEQLRVAVRRRLVAEVPVGALLSGGVDSSLIVALMAEAGGKPRTYTIGFTDVGDEKGNEFAYAAIVARAFGTEHEEIFVPETELLKRLPEAIAAMSEPMMSHDCVAFYLLSEAVSRHSKVVQSGQGADELFAGYFWYPKIANRHDPVGDYLGVYRDRDYDEYLEAVNPEWRVEDWAHRLVADHFARPGAAEPLDKALRLDTTVMLVDDPVKRVDNMTMAWGLEARVPFLDHELVELAAKIPPRHKLADGGKGVLKAAARQLLPHEVIDRPKGYFPVPALKYLQGAVLEKVREVLLSPAARSRGLFSLRYVEKLLAQPNEHFTRLRGSKLWQLGVLEWWLQTQVG